MADQTGGSRRYARNIAPAVPAITIGSAEDIVSTVVEAIGLASSIKLPVCFAASATVWNQMQYPVHQRKVRDSYLGIKYQPNCRN